MTTTILISVPVAHDKAVEVANEDYNRDESVWKLQPGAVKLQRGTCHQTTIWDGRRLVVTEVPV